MAIDLKPSTWFGPGYAADSGNHLIKLNTDSAPTNKLLDQLLDSKADPTTGDVRQLFFALSQSMYEAWLTQLSANNRPVQMNLSRSQSGDSSGNSTYIFNFQFTVTPTGIFNIPAES